MQLFYSDTRKCKCKYSLLREWLVQPQVVLITIKKGVPILKPGAGIQRSTSWHENKSVYSGTDMLIFFKAQKQTLPVNPSLINYCSDCWLYLTRKWFMTSFSFAIRSRDKLESQSPKVRLHSKSSNLGWHINQLAQVTQQSYSCGSSVWATSPRMSADCTATWGNRTGSLSGTPCSCV